MLLDTLRTLIVTNAPAALRLPVKFTPAIVQQTLLSQALQRVFHEALADGDFEFLQDRWLKIQVLDIDFISHISYQENQLVVQQSIPTAADVHFSGNLNDLILIAARKEDPDTLFFQRRLFIEGDTELGLEVKNLMDSVDLDALPAFMRLGLFRLADVVQQGLQPLKESEPAGIEYEANHAKQA